MMRKKLRNGFGSVKYLGKGRSCPYGVYPPAEYDENGKLISKKALAYVRTWEEGFAILTAYHAGTYEEGMKVSLPGDSSDESIMQYIMRKYTQKATGASFAQVYEKFYQWKYSTGELSQASERLTKTCFNLLKPLHDRVFSDLRHEDIQKVLLTLDCSESTKKVVRSLIKGMYKYAMINDLVKKDYSKYLKVDGAKPVHGEAFTDEEIKALWQNQTENDKLILIMIYSGFRISEYQGLEVNLEERYFKGGGKTKAGKDRIVPIHSGIYNLVSQRISRYGKLLPIAPVTLRHKSYPVLESLGISRHTPHDCRHTFSALCEKYQVGDNDRKRMLGHEFDDVTNKVYGHRSVEDLRKEIEKIKICR